jgi:hypothetical protein
VIWRGPQRAGAARHRLFLLRERQSGVFIHDIISRGTPVIGLLLFVQVTNAGHQRGVSLLLGPFDGFGLGS